MYSSSLTKKTHIAVIVMYYTLSSLGSQNNKDVAWQRGFRDDTLDAECQGSLAQRAVMQHLHVVV